MSKAKENETEEMRYRLEYNEERGVWHHEYIHKPYIRQENTNGYTTIADSVPSTKISKFSNFMDVYYGGELGAPKKGLTVEKVREDWKKFCMIWDSLVTP
jgi:hypothetical protein